MAARGWGYWTEHKLEMLAEYLRAFTTASTKAGTTLYLDLFAGVPENFSTTTGKPISGSPRIALDTLPAFTKVRLFELPAKAAKLEADLRELHGDRDLKVWPGDCNDEIDKALAELAPLNWAPTFSSKLPLTMLADILADRRMNRPGHQIAAHLAKSASFAGVGVQALLRAG